MTRVLVGTSLCAVLVMTGCTNDSGENNSTGISAAQKKEVLTTYADMALATYTDTYEDAVALRDSIVAFLDENDTTKKAQKMQDAKEAWLHSRESYLQTEAFRLSEGPIDAETGWVATAYGALEGEINAWPLNESLIDYTVDTNGNINSGNTIINTASSAFISFKTPDGTDANLTDDNNVSTQTITTAMLQEFTQKDGDANVATGYHAIEFLLWGQDQDYGNSDINNENITAGALVAGQRPVTDYTTEANATRRSAMLKAEADLLVEDLARVKSAWETTAGSCTTGSYNGCYRLALLGSSKGEAKAIDPDTALQTIIRGLGVFVKSELANERVAAALDGFAEEEEHSCFSDNTHRDLLVDYKGFLNILYGTYNGVKYGTGMYELLSDTLQADIKAKTLSLEAKLDKINRTAETVAHFDYQIAKAADGSTTTEARTTIRDTKNELRALADKMADVATAFSISLTTDDVTDDEHTSTSN